MPSGSLPWLILTAVICTAFAIFLESAFLAPTAEALMGTEVWKTNHNTYAWEGKQRVADFVTNLVMVFAIGIWFGVLIDARRSV